MASLQQGQLASSPATGEQAGIQQQPGPSQTGQGLSRVSKNARAPKAARGGGGGGNSDHRKEQNRIASRNYREKRKQKLALLNQILGEPPAGSSSNVTASTGTSQPGASAPAQLPGLVASSASAAASGLAGAAAGQTPHLPDTSGGAQGSFLNVTADWTPTSSGSDGFNDRNAHTPYIPQASANQLLLLPITSPSPSANLDSIAGSIPYAYNPEDDGSTAGLAEGASAALFSDMLLPDTPLLFSRAFFKEGASAQGLADTTNTLLDQSALFHSPGSYGGPATGAAGTATPAVSGPPPPLSSGHTPAHPMLAPSPTAAPLPAQSARPFQNRPMVRAMLRTVKRLSARQRRLLLDALLEEENSRDAGVDEIEEVLEGAVGREAGGEDLMALYEDDEDENGGATQSIPDRQKDVRAQQLFRELAHWHGYDNQLAPGFLPPELAAPIPPTPMAPASVLNAASAFSFATSASFSSPVTHINLQCSRALFRAAIIQNCYATGLANAASIFDEAACDSSTNSSSSGGEPAEDYCSSDYLQSPFALEAPAAKKLVARGRAAIRECVATLQDKARGSGTPPDLQPTEAQILVGHHPYLDVIPFPTFRQRTLMLLAEMEAAEQPEALGAIAQAVSGGELNKRLRKQGAAAATGGCGGKDLGGDTGISVVDLESPDMSSTPLDATATWLLDEDELCYDMSVADGMVCWGANTGTSSAAPIIQAHRDTGSAARDMRVCVPWDMRSWEPQVWFLKKYWFLVGGWDDEMWRNCRWWHTMRGEVLDYSVFTSRGY